LSARGLIAQISASPNGREVPEGSGRR
jgi:hypothetical protein